MNRSTAKEIALDQVSNSWQRIVDLLCDCDGAVSMRGVSEWEGVRLQGGCHTEFMLMCCTACNRIRGFPNDNLLLAIEFGTDETRNEIREFVSAYKPKRLRWLRNRAGWTFRVILRLLP